MALVPEAILEKLEPMGMRFRHCSETLGTCLGCPQHSQDSGMGWTLGLSTLQWDARDMSLPFPRMECEGQWDLGTLLWDAQDVSGMFPAFLGLWDGKDSGI